MAMMENYHEDDRLQDCFEYGHFRLLYPFLGGATPKRILFPIHIDGNHWILGMLIAYQNACYYLKLDSGDHATKTANTNVNATFLRSAQLVFTYLQFRFPTYYDAFHLQPAPESICIGYFNQMQNNNEDCGIIACINAMHLVFLGVTRRFNTQAARAFMAAVICRWDTSILDFLPHYDPHNPEWERTFHNLDQLRSTDTWPAFIVDHTANSIDSSEKKASQINSMLYS